MPRGKTTMPIDWPAKIWHLLLTTLFSLAVAGLQWAFDPQRPLAPLIAYSVAIGWVTWAVIDLGRHRFASAQETGWPAGWRAGSGNPACSRWAA